MTQSTAVATAAAAAEDEEKKDDYYVVRLEAKAAELAADMTNNRAAFLEYAACLPQPKSLTLFGSPSREALLQRLECETEPLQQP